MHIYLHFIYGVFHTTMADLNNSHGDLKILKTKNIYWLFLKSYPPFLAAPSPEVVYSTDPLRRVYISG